MARTGLGYAVWSGGELANGKIASDVERATFTCCHCNDVTFIPAGGQPGDCGGFCTMCNDHTCKGCATRGGCEPFEKKLEASEARGRLRASIGA